MQAPANEHDGFFRTRSRVPRVRARSHGHLPELFEEVGAMKMTGSVIKGGVAAAGLCLLLGAGAGAADVETTIFRWKDDQGMVHVTDSLDKVPEQYRGQVTQYDASRPADAAGSQQAAQPPAQQGGQASAGAGDDGQKAAWQQKLRAARQKMAEAEGRQLSLMQRKARLESPWGSAGASLPPQTVIDERNQIDADLKRTEQEIAEARRAVDVEIPEAARKAGVPPGWLREVQ
jgi:hypothetical protein